ncbi:MAG: helix-turn-helix domain-containing protein [Candidatus Doudnabacteria bacterium]
MKKEKLFAHAVAMRKNGYSYNEISQDLDISKSTASKWLVGVKVGRLASKRLLVRSEIGRVRSRETIALRTKAHDELLKGVVLKDISSVKLDRSLSKLLCSFLYWGEGSKSDNGVRFTNSDPVMIKLFLELFSNSFDLDYSRLSASLHLHSYHDRAFQIEFWSKVTNIPTDRIRVYSKKNSGKIKRKDYPGCIQIRYNDIAFLKQLVLTYQMFSKKQF